MKNNTRIIRPDFLLTVLFFSFVMSFVQMQVAFSQVKINSPVTLPMKVSDGGHLMIKATINGVEGNFIFDTAAGLNLMTKKFADKVAGLNKLDGTYTAHRATGEAITAELWKANSINIGGLNYTDQLVSIIDLDFPFDGLISLLPFRNTPITINYKTKSLVIESAKSLKALAKTGQSVPLQLADDREKALDVFAEVKVNDKLTLQVSFDSGAGAKVYRFNSKLMKPLGIDTTKAEVKYNKSEFNPEKRSKYYTTTLSKVSIPGTDVMMKDTKAYFLEGLIYDGIMSMDWLGEVLTIDIPNRRLLIN
ncbi:retropepsin-like aspartic protease [Pedobacter gandavensis]|uniref:retropepsin-like aspartic protease n=1 Tax=Pedobacter gandavensis TaxID=2679963 RepID=UPI00292E45E8|nr:retropepsin-like aspartic protease [Pedobacter gandavensis]